MVKHTQTIILQQHDELFEWVWPFCGVDSYRVNIDFEHIQHNIDQIKLVILYLQLRTCNRKLGWTFFLVRLFPFNPSVSRTS